MRRGVAAAAGLMTGILVAGYLAVGAGLGAGLGEAAAAKAADVLKGRIIISEKAFPSRFASDGAMVAHMKKVNKTELVCDKEGVWEFYYMAFFAKPLDDVQVTVNLYDLTTGGEFIMGADQYTSARGERILASYFKFTREEIPSNHKVSIVIVHKGSRLATTEVKMRDDRKFKGKVDFGDDEAK
ncbi:MAG TPA: hypothetical protein VG389_03380 [Myxococcota bacterium]|jgi:hypothetical protein|nr:hypothetical protein [Myxococcota bacterium]